MAQERFLQILQCPYCGGELELERREPRRGLDVEFGILRCRCYRYAIVLGIPVIRQCSPPNNSKDPIVAELDDLEYDKAVRLLLARELRPTVKLRAALLRAAESVKRGGRRGGTALPAKIIQPSEDLHAALARLRPTYYGEYLYYRHANPSLLAALPILAAIASRAEDRTSFSSPYAAHAATDTLWSIDLGCGIGHTAYSLKALLPQTQMVAADLDILNLLFAKRYFMSDASFVCFDAEAGFPFRDGVFRTAFSLDCVHYIRGKVGLAKELRRIGNRDTLYAIAHLHNAKRLNVNPGIPLAADGYSKVFEPLNGRIYSEAKLLETFCNTGFLSLEEASTDASISSSNAFIYLSLGKELDNFWSRRLDRYMAQRTDHLALNALYAAARVGSSFELRLQWPSQALKEECCVDFQPLKEKVDIAPAFADSVLAHRFSDLPPDTLETLIRSFVIVPQPSDLVAVRQHAR